MANNKRTRRDIANILVLGTGLSVGTAVESRLAPSVAVFPKFAPVASVAAPIIGAGIVLRQLNRLGQVPNLSMRQRLAMRQRRMRRRRFL